MWTYQRLIEFLGIGGILPLIQNHQFDLQHLLTSGGISALISPIFPALLLLELAFLAWVNRRSTSKMSAAYKVPTLMYVANILVAALINLDVLVVTFNLFAKLAPFQADMRIRWFLYAYVVWELSHYVYHWTCHKVRVLWCLHSPHHAPQHMNLSVIYTAFFLQGTYATFVRTAICAVLGVPFPLLLLVMTVDGFWGAFIHISEEVWPSGRLRGFFGRAILNPIHHRIHHSKNPEYIDKNYCNLLPVWDMAFGTLKHEASDVKPVYGITREVRHNSFVDMYAGDLILLMDDIRKAPTIKQKMQHIFMPPGWKPKKNAHSLEAVG